MSVFKYISEINLKDYWLHGRLYPLKESPNISKMFDYLTEQLNSIIVYSNRLYPSIYPCLGIELLHKHMIELGLPDRIFRDSSNFYNFPYTFPIPFFNGSTNHINTDWDTLRKDIIIKKYLMQDNSILGFKKVASIYGVCIDIEEYQEVVVTGFEDLGKASNGANLSYIRFPYKFPLCFCKGVGGGFASRIKQINPNKRFVNSFVKIKIYKTDDITYLKLKEIFKWMKPITTNLVFERLNTLGTCDLNALRICKYLKT